jgi:UDP-glucose 4-epimerase
VFVHDVVSANLTVSDLALEGGSGLDDFAFNVGTGEGTSVLRLAEVIEKVAGRSTGRGHRPERPGELRHSTLDCTRLRACGWAPSVSLEEGLRETYEFIRSQRAETPE